MIEGSCQCGGVQIVLSAIEPVGYNCYCEICRKIAGAPFASVVMTKPGSLEIERGRELLAKYNATANYDRWHCSRCHAAIYGEVTDKPQYPLYVSATILPSDAVAQVRFEHIFVGSAVPWHPIADGQRHQTYP